MIKYSTLAQELENAIENEGATFDFVINCVFEETVTDFRRLIERENASAIFKLRPPCSRRDFFNPIMGRKILLYRILQFNFRVLKFINDNRNDILRLRMRLINYVFQTAG